MYNQYTTYPTYAAFLESICDIQKKSGTYKIFVIYFEEDVKKDFEMSLDIRYSIKDRLKNMITNKERVESKRMAKAVAVFNQVVDDKNWTRISVIGENNNFNKSFVNITRMLKSVVE